MFTRPADVFTKKKKLIYCYLIGKFFYEKFLYCITTSKVSFMFIKLIVL